MMRTAFLLVMLIGCTSSSEEGASTEEPGPRSTLAADVSLRDLSDAQRTTLCTWWGETVGEGRMQSCSECHGDACTDWDVATSTVQDCVEWLQGADCDATVHEAEYCAFAQVPDLCASTPACNLLSGC